MLALTVGEGGCKKEADERLRVRNYSRGGLVGMKYKWVAHRASQADQELQKGEREEKARMMLVK